LKVTGLAPQYVIYADRPKDQLDQLKISVETTSELGIQSEPGVSEAQTRANDEMYEMLGVHSTVVVVEPRKLERSLGKVVRVVDRRGVMG